MIRDINDTLASASFLVMGVVFILRAASWPARIAYFLATVAGIVVPWALARRAIRRERLQLLLADLALYGRKPEPHEDVPTFLLRIEHEVFRAEPWIRDEQVRCVRVLLTDYRKGRSS